MKRDTLKLRARGQITIPKEWLDKIGAREGDFFLGVLESVDSGRIVLEFQSTARVTFSDALHQYVIADLAAEGHSPAEIDRLLPERKARLEQGYAKYLRETAKAENYVREKDWSKEFE